MPGYKAHIIIGIITTSALSYTYTLLSKHLPDLTFLEMLLIIPIVLISSLTPDLDSYTGKLRTILFKLLFWSLVFLIIIALFINEWFAILLATIYGLIGTYLMGKKHRGPLHKPLFVIIVSSPLLFIHWFLAVIAVSNGLSHIYIDKTHSKAKRMAKIKYWTRKMGI